MVANLTEEEKDLFDKVTSNPGAYIVEVDKHVIYILNKEMDKVEGVLKIHGIEIVVALLRYMGLNAQFI